MQVKSARSAKMSEPSLIICPILLVRLSLHLPGQRANLFWRPIGDGSERIDVNAPYIFVKDPQRRITRCTGVESYHALRSGAARNQLYLNRPFPYPILGGCGFLEPFF
ncbi:hypothetical protein ARMSODRAFT_289290 [Armillaria solidipes]|uniref:Uncharacterized protein n=1 Tax=Armillaria solidipes TaxID=1076256 RepID=A0A2H3C3C1_9AGAR|nr:hypothetical protein ARMSODRAFT_289290 [Armillaria solidipes]